MIVQKLKPWVTSFSEAIVKMCKHGDAVCVGGEIVEIFNMADILDGVEDPELQDNSVYLTLDDGVGLNHLVMPVEAYQHYNAKHGLLKGMIVLAKGRVYQVDIMHRGKPAKNSSEQTTRIACWEINPLQAEEPTIQSEA